MSVSFKIKTPRARQQAHARRVNDAGPRVAFQVGSALAHDAVFKAPRPPIQWGVLRGSVKTEVIPGGARVSFPVAYALKLHEASEDAAASWPSKSIDPASGPKFLEAKILMFRDEYRKLAARAMREETL